MRTFDVLKIAEAVKFIRKIEEDFDPIEWVSDHRNVCLTNELGDLSLFEYNHTSLVTGHYYFQSRGKAALQAAKEFLDEIFDPCYNIQVIRGLTALDHLGARWLSRQLGFKSYGVLDVNGRKAELFILTKQEWLNK